MEKTAILIDGGFLLKRLPTIQPDSDVTDPEAVATAISKLVSTHLNHQNALFNMPRARALLYRVFYYDAVPYAGKTQLPISKQPLDYSKTDAAIFRTRLHEKLRHKANTAVRLGEVRKERNWILSEAAQKQLLAGRKTVADLTDDDFFAGLRQKAVDMRIGLDIASITLKRQASTIVLVSGDSDFVPAAKLARREGVKVVLDPLWNSVAPSLFEHIDGVFSGFPKPKPKNPPPSAP